MAAAVSAKPAPHGALTSTQAARPLALAYVEPVTHGAHCKSAVAEPETATPSPAAHVRHNTHALFPASLLNVPAAHGAQLRSLLAVATKLTYVPAAHGALTGWHGSLPLLAEYATPTTHGVH